MTLAGSLIERAYGKIRRPERLSAKQKSDLMPAYLD